jgi:predicted permease
MREWLWRLKAMLVRDRLVADKTEELQFHYDMEVRDGVRRGLTADEANRRARQRAGLVSHGVESTRDELGIRWLDGLALDLRHAVRALTRNRSFGIVALLVLAASVAVNTLIFFMLDGIVLRPLPYKTPERLVRLFDTTPRTPKFPMSIGRYVDYRAHARSLDGLALYTGRDMELSGTGGGSEPVSGMLITTDFFTLLGQPPSLGRAFTDADLRRDVRHVILSHRLWVDRFQSDPAILGKPVRIDRQAWTVVGVAAKGFQHVGGDYRSPLQGDSVDVWLPLPIDLNEGPLRGAHFTNAVARLRDGVTAIQAREELASLADAYSKRYANFGAWGVRVEPLLDEVTGRSSQVIWLLVFAGALVLTVACANIAGLSVARAVARRRELALRRALGARRWQLVRVGLVENALVGVAGALVGLALAWSGLPLLRQLLPEGFPRAHEVALTPASAIFAVTIAIVTVLAAGLLASRGAGATLTQQRVSEGREAKRLRTALVVGEVALAGVLCAGAVFLLRSYQELGRRDHAFRTEQVLTFRLSFQRGPSTQPGDLARLYGAVRENIRAIPEVAAVGASTNLPWSGYDENSGFRIVGREADAHDGPGARYQAATPGYFEAMGMRLAAGRLFDDVRDARGQPATLIVNDALAARYFPNGDAVGATVALSGQNRQIVGVVSGVRDTPADAEVKPAFWWPLGQMEFASVFFAVRTNGSDPAALTAAVTDAVHRVDPELPLADVRSMDRRAAGALASQRFALWLFQAFAALALLLAAAGIYGLLAYVVRQRRKELGIRVALGAARSDLSKMVFGDALKMTALGAAVCLVLIPLGGWLLRAFLYNVRAFDAITLVSAPAALLVVSLIASLGPALSAARANPSTALRED